MVSAVTNRYRGATSADNLETRNYDRGRNIQRLLNDFNESLSQVIEVNKKLHSGLSNPPSLRQSKTPSVAYSDTTSKTRIKKRKGRRAPLTPFTRRILRNTIRLCPSDWPATPVAPSRDTAWRAPSKSLRPGRNHRSQRAPMKTYILSAVRSAARMEMDDPHIGMNRVIGYDHQNHFRYRRRRDPHRNGSLNAAECVTLRRHHGGFQSHLDAIVRQIK